MLVNCTRRMMQKLSIQALQLLRCPWALLSAGLVPVLEETSEIVSLLNVSWTFEVVYDSFVSCSKIFRPSSDFAFATGTQSAPKGKR